MNHSRIGGLIAVGLAMLGCNGPQSASGPVTPEPEGILRRQIADLPTVGAYSPPLDGNLLEVAPPDGWTLIRGRTFLIGWAKADTDALPRITINAEEPPAGSPEQLTAENAAEFAAQLDQELKKIKKRVEEPCLPIVLGQTVFVRHVRRVTFDSSPCILQSLQTVQNSRLYTVDLVAEINSPQASNYEDSLIAVRDYGYAVAANMRFAGPGEKLDPLAGLPAAPIQPNAKVDKKAPDDKPPTAETPPKKPADRKTGKPKPPA
jgi:hypothetical protein